MTRFLMRLFAFALLAGSALAPSLRAVTTYQVDKTGGTCVSSRTIHASDSGMTSAQYAITVYANSARVPVSQYSATIDTSTHHLSLSFSSNYFPSGHCGLIKLRGMYVSDTSSSSDFEASAQGDYILVTHQGDYSRRTYSGHTFASDVDSIVGIVHGWSLLRRSDLRLLCA